MKVQVPLQSTSNKDNLLMIYDKRKSVQNYLSPRVGAGRPHALLTDAVKAAPLKVKGYFNAKLEERDGLVCLVVDPAAMLPPQPW